VAATREVTVMSEYRSHDKYELVNDMSSSDDGVWYPHTSCRHCEQAQL
jgi:hypothetical protein